MSVKRPSTVHGPVQKRQCLGEGFLAQALHREYHRVPSALDVAGPRASSKPRNGALTCACSSAGGPPAGDRAADLRLSVHRWSGWLAGPVRACLRLLVRCVGGWWLGCCACLGWWCWSCGVVLFRCCCRSGWGVGWGVS
ncbi:hypothetical protein FPZ41_42965, partial [Streptomyces sp. K1PN6]|nr:hypothetical protein [Streptomyces acidicola]